MSTRGGIQFRGGGPATESGTGNANVGGELRQRGEGPGVGLYISTPEADPSWHIRGVERQLEEAAAEARVEIAGAGGTSVGFLLPLDYALGLPEALNVHDIEVTTVDAVRAAVRASAASGPLTLTEDTAGFGTISFSAAAGDPLKNAFARVVTSGGSLDITRPDLAVRARGTWPTPRVGIQVEYVAYGTAGNGFRIDINGALDTAQTENYTVAAAYSSDTRLVVTITFNSTASTNVAYSDIAAAINLARRNNNQLVAAVTQSGSATGTASQSSASGSTFIFSGGGEFSGADTNVGRVAVHRTGARVEEVAGAAASGTYDNKLKLTANTPGTYGNIRVVFEDWATSGSGIAVAQEGASRINVAFRNPFGTSNDDTTFTLASIKAAIEGFTGTGIPTFTVSYVGGASGTDTITRAASGAGDHFWDTTLTGGVDPVPAANQLRATWSDVSNALEIYALPTDPMVDVAAAILALDEFAAADLEYSTGSTPNTDTLTLGPNVGDALYYAFANGTDKSVLALTGDPIEFPAFYTFGISGVVPEVTTAQELVDFINGLDGPDDFVTASVTSGSSGTDTFDSGAITLDVAGGDAGQPAVAMSVVLAQTEIEVTIQTGRSLQSIASPTQYWRDEDGTPTAVAYPLDERDAAPATHTAHGILFTETNPTRPSTTVSFSWSTDGEVGDTLEFPEPVIFPSFVALSITGIIPGVTTVQDIITLFNAPGNERFLAIITPSVAPGAQGSDTIPESSLSFDFTDGLPGEPTGNRIETGDQTAVIAALPDPFRPTGGRNYVPASPIEALVRGEDEADGENVEVRYHATDTLRDIIEALEAQGAVTVVEIYGTSLGDFPEEPPYERAMFPEGGSTEGADGGLTQVSSDGTLTGRGTSGSPLRVARPFTQGDETHLDALPPLWAAGVHVVGDQVSWAGKVYRCISGRSATDTGNPATDTTGWAEVGTGSTGPGGGLASVATDTTLTGDGTTGNPLMVARPFSAGMENKVTNLPDPWYARDWAVGEQCIWSTYIYQCDVARLETHTTQPQNDPAWRRVGDLADIATDATITGDGTSGDPLAVAHPFTDEDKAKLDSLENADFSDYEVQELTFFAGSTLSSLDGLSPGAALKFGAAGSTEDIVVAYVYRTGAANSEVYTVGFYGGVTVGTVTADLTTASDTRIRRLPNSSRGGSKAAVNSAGEWHLSGTMDAAGIAAFREIARTAGGSGGTTDATARAAAAAAQATADAALPKAGGTMTGKITLDGAPTADLHAATKKYVDDNAGGGGTGAVGPVRAESIGFANIVRAATDVELALNVAAATVEHGATGSAILSGLNSGTSDFTIKAGAYLVELSGQFRGFHDASVVGFKIRAAADDSDLTTNSSQITPDQQEVEGAIKELLFLAADTEVNVQLTRTQESRVNLPKLTIVALGGAASGGSTPMPADDFLFGTSDDAVPVAGELTIMAANGMAEIAAYAGSRHVLLARLASEADITTVRRSDDLAQLNQVGAFTKHGSVIDVSGTDYSVWVSNQALTQSAAVTWTAS